MENNNDVAIIRKWYDVKTGLYVRDWTEEEYKRLSSDEHILEECDDGDLIECYCKEKRMWKNPMWYRTGVSNLSFATSDRIYTTSDRTYRYNTSYWI